MIKVLKAEMCLELKFYIVRRFHVECYKIFLISRCEPGRGVADGEESAVADGFFKERSEFKKSLVSVEPFEQAVRSAPTNGSARSVADEGGRGKNGASRDRAGINGTMPIIHSDVAIRLLLTIFIIGFYKLAKTFIGRLKIVLWRSC